MTKTLLRPTSKGQVTIPVSIRRQLNINPETLLDVAVKDEQIIFRPLKLTDLNQRRHVYSSGEIDRFLRDDIISTEDAAFFRHLLK